jgi:predicted RNA-binding Zn-ribbon protein involved in translation (DUF1610 family)
MSVSEIKCPHCGEWTMWQGRVDDRCISCGEFIEPNRFSRDVERRINKELKKEDDFFAIKPTDGQLTRWIKAIFNSLRWGAYYLQLALFAFITLLLVLLSILTG